MNEVTACITVRRIASGVGVEKTFLLHSPNISKIEILRRAKVRRNFLSYLRDRRGKSARLKEVTFDKAAANDVTVPDDPKDNSPELTLDEAQVEDALNDAIPLSQIENSENQQVSSGDDTTAV